MFLAEWSRPWGRRPVSGRVPADGDRSPRQASPLAHRVGLWVAVATAAIVVGWAALVFAVEQARFVVLAPRVQIGVEAASGLARLFCAFVLFLFPDERVAPRLRWIAGGFVVLGLGGLVFGYLQPVLGGSLALNTSICVSTLVWSLAGALMVVGVVPAAPPRFGPRSMAAILSASSLAIALVLVGEDLLPTLVRLSSLEAAMVSDHAALSGLMGWYWALSSVPLALAVLAVVGAAHRRSDEALGGWLLVAMVLLAGSQLHNLFWPSVYSPALTTSSLLRLAFASVLAAGGVVGLRRVAAERERLAADRVLLLAAEQEFSRRLVDLARLKADFTAMVAHELGGPVAAVRRYAEALETGRLGPDGAARAVSAIQAEADLLDSLVDDVQTIAGIDRAEFVVRRRPVPVNALLADAVAFAEGLPGSRPVTAEVPEHCRVLADPERIGQVLRNLMSNAAKYSPPGSTIALRARRHDDRMRIEVADRGCGVHPDDRARIFDKFARGRDLTGRRQHGMGLGLYVCRRIAQAHGTDLTVESSPGRGAVFAFELLLDR